MIPTKTSVYFETPLFIHGPGYFDERSHTIWYWEKPSTQLESVIRDIKFMVHSLGHMFLFTNLNMVGSPPYQLNYQMPTGHWSSLEACDASSLRSYLNMWFAGEYRWSDVEQLLADCTADGGHRGQQLDLNGGSTLTLHRALVQRDSHNLYLAEWVRNF